MAIKKALNDCFFCLNPNFIEDLQNHVITDSNNKYTLETLIDKYSFKYPNDTTLMGWIDDLNNDDSITVQEGYHELIDYLLADIDI